MKPSKLLKQQHRQVIAALKKMEKGSKAERRSLLEEVSNDLAAHMAIEQEIFYPACQAFAEDAISEAYEEHSLAELALKRLRDTGPDDEAFRPRCVALRELLQHHIEEEEGVLIPKAEKRLDDDELDQVTQRMQARFEEVREEGFEAAVPVELDQTSADLAQKQQHEGRPDGRGMSEAQLH